MKAILISIQPRHIANILNLIKTLEIRKRFPKDYVGWVYIYCTKKDDLGCIKKISKDKYVCGKDFDIDDFNYLASGYNGKGKVVARFWCDMVAEFYDFDNDVCECACLGRGEMLDYLGDNNGYAIHITKLEIFDKPKEISEFKYYKKFSEIDYMLPIPRKETCERLVPLTRAPESWCYIEI